MLAESDARVIDGLFEGQVNESFRSSVTRSDLRCAMRLNRKHPSAAWFWAPVVAGPEAALDQLIERAVWRRVLLDPGLFLGVESFARALHTDAATAVAHLERLFERHLIHRLCLLDRAPSPNRLFTKTRIHPVSTAFVVDALQGAGHDMATEPCTFAKVLRTFCVGQLIEAAAQAAQRTECFHWRKFVHRMREVDLVLQRGKRLVGITVRNSLAARPDTIGSLRILAEDERFFRGFIFYMGRMPRRLAENIWALPISALWESEAFLPGLSSFEN